MCTKILALLGMACQAWRRFSIGIDTKATHKTVDKNAKQQKKTEGSYAPTQAAERMKSRPGGHLGELLQPTTAAAKREGRVRSVGSTRSEGKPTTKAGDIDRVSCFSFERVSRHQEVGGGRSSLFLSEK